VGDLLEHPKEKSQPEDNVPLKVEDAMVRKVVTVNENSSVREAVKIMNQFEIGSVIVVSEGKAAGIVTERDILKRIVAVAKDANRTKVKEVMSSPLVTIEPRIELEEAVKLMFQMKIKKLPVVEGERLVGLLSLTDVARFHPQIMKMLKRFANEQPAPRSIKKVIDYIV
jgi:CBS domain-containing protein